MPRGRDMIGEDWYDEPGIAAAIPAPLTPATKDTLQTEAVSWASKVAALRIHDAPSCVDASHFLRSIKGLRADIQRWFEPHVEAAMETKRKAEAARKQLIDERDRMEAPLVTAEATVKKALLTWETQQEQERQAQERALQAAAQARAEVATLAAAAALELEATATGNAEMLQEAQDILAQPIEAPIIHIEAFVPKVQGVTYRDQWKAHPDIDVKVLAGAVAAGTVPLTFIAPNLTAINQFVRATQGTQPIPGVRVCNDRQIAARG